MLRSEMEVSADWLLVSWTPLRLSITLHGVMD